jgi:hypothetical protein
VIDIEQRALRALEQNALAFAALLVEPRHTGRHRAESWARSPSSASAAPRVDFGQPEPAAQRVVMRSSRSILAGSDFGSARSHHADRAPADLVFIGRADAAPVVPILRAVRGFARAVELAMQRQDQRRVLGDAQIVRRDGDALRLDALDLVERTPRDRPRRRCR